MRGNNVSYEDINREEINFGKNNFLEIVRRKAITEDGEREFISISRGFYAPDGSKRYKKGNRVSVPVGSVDELIEVLGRI